MVIAAILFSILTGVVCLFQLALAFGAPWGAAALGGRFPGKFPLKLRILALVQLVLLALFAVTVLTKAQLLLPQLYSAADRVIWFVVGFTALSLLGNIATPSKTEQRLWAPVASIMLVCSLVVALN